MPTRLVELFEDDWLRHKIQKKLPFLFQIVQVENQRAGKTGMQVGSARESVLVGLLIYRFGEAQVNAQTGITEHAVDVHLFGEPLSIKTITGSGGVKASWTVGPEKAQEFIQRYEPPCDILLAQIRWGRQGGLFLIPRESQQKVLRKLGNEGFLKPPKPGTNPRGIEFRGPALRAMLQDKDTKGIEIVWERSQIDYNPYRRWVEYWQED